MHAQSAAQTAFPGKNAEKTTILIMLYGPKDMSLKPPLEPDDLPLVCTGYSDMDAKRMMQNVAGALAAVAVAVVVASGPLVVATGAPLFAGFFAAKGVGTIWGWLDDL
ncbi:hypothetical protein [Paraburkholderia sp.]|uniref:hypothetical protein n=1 Tax=Paraburkholderia sp. TaxID=1926495 RepID=UPI0025D05846|nr:hypothetical protein [Paraburkholderia sp.]